MITDPKIEIRVEQPCVAIPAHITMQEFSLTPPLFKEIFEWIQARQIIPAGPPFIRYVTFTAGEKLGIEVGIPIGGAVAGDGRVIAGTIPGGSYATLRHTGDYEGPKGLRYANTALLDWMEREKLIWKHHREDQTVFCHGRFEFYLTDPAEQPDPAQWVTEVAYQIEDSTAS